MARPSLMARATVFVLVAHAVGCVHAERATGPDGHADWWRITCPGGDDDACYDKAHELCPDDYRVAPVAEAERKVDAQCHRTAAEEEFNIPKSCRGELLIRCASPAR